MIPLSEESLFTGEKDCVLVSNQHNFQGYVIKYGFFENLELTYLGAFNFFTAYINSKLNGNF